ncbi:hypothetical protein [Sphaerotilus sp.]|uniref:hypothetical protein n=1 Tax=Sphaerotilus sp. TaxID=2093942 RepID=UPI00286E23E6|nr:hypothetical protein [Sphaerotilus sp.]
MNATMKRRLAALEGAKPPAPEDEAHLSWEERYRRMISLPMPRRRLKGPDGPDMTPEEAYRMMLVGDPS